MTAVSYLLIGFFMGVVSLVFSQNFKGYWHEDGYETPEMQRIALFLFVWVMWPVVLVGFAMAAIFAIVAGIGWFLLKTVDFLSGGRLR